MARILLIDDDELLRRTVVRMLAAGSHTVFQADNGKTGAEILKTKKVDVVVTDVFMPEREGLETISLLRRADPALKIIAISGGWTRSGVDYLDMAKQLGAQATLTKPFTKDQILAAVEGCLGHGGG